MLGGDYGPYTQSERLDIYIKAVNDLLSGGFAYPCFCTEKRLQLLRKESARNRVPNRHCDLKSIIPFEKWTISRHPFQKN